MGICFGVAFGAAFDNVGEFLERHDRPELSTLYEKLWSERGGRG